MKHSHTNLLTRAEELIDAGHERGTPLRLVGSGGFRRLATDPRVHTETLNREMGDIDLVGISDDSGTIRNLFNEFGYEVDKDLLLAGWGNRYVFYGDDHEVDVFLDKINMCHTIELSERLTAGMDQYTLPAADLLLEKSQIIKINKKDLKDLILLLMETPLTDDETGINRTYISNLLANDWGFYNTVTMNLQKLQSYLDTAPVTSQERDRVQNRVENLLATIESAPKSLRWKARSMVGERVQWYNEVEEKHR